MGPRSHDRGNAEMASWFPLLRMLQWGRDLMIAEMAKVSVRNEVGSPRQWGRDLMIAEISDPGPSILHHRKLQWGRDLMIAEMTSLWIRSQCSTGFNGAAIS